MSRIVSRWSRLSVVAALVVASGAFAGWSKKGDAEASFVGTGPAGFKIEGTTKNVDIKDDGKALVIAIKLPEVSTGIAVRDKHMHEDMGAEQFPDCSLTVALDQLKVPEDGKSLEAEAKGTLLLHGKSNVTTFKYKATCAKGSCDVEGSADVNVKDHDIKIRSYMGITVKSDIKVATKFTVAR